MPIIRSTTVSSTTKSLLNVAVGCSVLLILASSGGKAAAAGSGPSITTSPVTIDLTGKPGSTITTTLHLENDGTSSIIEGVKLEEFKALGDRGEAQIFNPPKNNAAANWVHFSETTFTAQPGVWNSIIMTVSLPKTAALGYYYAVIFAPKVAASVLPNHTADVLKSANAILVLVDAKVPNENDSLYLQSFTSTKSAYQYLPANFNIDIHNIGNIYTIPSGDVYISRTLNGPVIDSLNLNSGGGNILPGTNRVFQTQWTDGFPVYKPKTLDGQVLSGKNGLPIEQLQWNITRLPKFRFGKYYARLVVVYNNGTRDIPIESEVSFWVIPWTLIIGFVLFLALLGVGLWTIIRTISKRVKPRSARRKW
jgi:hypothetical protein